MTKPFGTDIPSSTSAGLRTAETLDEASRVMQVQAEQIERLQMAIGLASTIRGNVQDWLADPLKMMREVVMYVELLRDEAANKAEYFAERNSARDAWRRAADERDLLRPDAERYRWLRDHGVKYAICQYESSGPGEYNWCGWIPFDTRSTDAAIDAAMKEEGK